MKLSNKRVVVLGGGTAGWFAALFTRKFLSNNVTLIESKKLGIIGVGEGTVPSINPFLKYIDIHPYEVIAHTGGSLKNGISFERWNENSKDDVYFHSFNDTLEKNNFSIPGLFDYDCRDYYLKECISKGKNLKEWMWSARMSYENKVDDETILTALHFDTFALGDFLSTKADERGITHIDGRYIDSDLDENGFIKNIKLDDGRQYDCDFVFDCTGLSKEILGKKLNTKFVSYNDTLAMKKAIVIPEQEPGNFPYTRAVAMPNGWIFEIPLQHRVGRGYIFDSDYIDETQAHKEASEYYGKEVDVKKVINFDAGRMENAWVKNCIGLGLSQSFVEPLEATSIFCTTEMLTHLKHFKNCFENYNEKAVMSYNIAVNGMLDNVRDFIRFHYISKRNDSKFWREFPEKYKMSDRVKYMVDILSNGHLNYMDVPRVLGNFITHSWISVGNGMRIFNNYDISGYDTLSPSLEEIKVIMDERAKEMPLMSDWLKVTNENFK